MTQMNDYPMSPFLMEILTEPGLQAGSLLFISRIQMFLKITL